jgi:hypothetical protein
MRGALILLILSCCSVFTAARAQDTWMDSVLGPYEGPVLNAGKIQHLTTHFELDASGRLIGHYHVEDNPPFDGELTDFQPDGESQGTFTWHDPFGHGVVHIRFDPDHARFIGRWGLDQPWPDNVFNGFRVRPPAVS